MKSRDVRSHSQRRMMAALKLEDSCETSDRNLSRVDWILHLTSVGYVVIANVLASANRREHKMS